MKRRARELRDQTVALTIQALQFEHRATCAIGRSTALVADLLDNLEQGDGLLRSSLELKRSITDYVKTLRTLGEPAERAVENVRLIADDAVHALHIRRGDGEGLLNQMVLWAIDAFAA